MKKIVVMFPGQGAYFPKALSESFREKDGVRQVLLEVDAVAGRRLGGSLADLLLGADAPGIETMLEKHADMLQMALFTLSVGAFRRLQTMGTAPALLIGHSLGEIAALTASGAFTVGEGAEIVCHRISALKAAGGEGYMAALGTDMASAGRLVEFMGPGVGIACRNAPSQTVLSGMPKQMDKARGVADVMGIPFVRLNSPYPFHSALMARAGEEFVTRLAGIRQRPITIPVFSPILGRCYNDQDRLSALLGEHLVRPVDFVGAVHSAFDQGIRIFLECGAGNTLSKAAGHILKDKEAEVIAAIHPGIPEAESWSRVEAKLRSAGGLQPAAAGLESAAAGSWIPRLEGVDWKPFAAFWQENSTQILDGIRARFLESSKARLPSPQPPPTLRPEPASPPSSLPDGRTAVRAVDRHRLFRELVDFYSQALEYPGEVFGEDVELEAELGVDSVKQTELLSRVGENYHLPPRPENFRLGDYRTLGQVADFVHGLLIKNGAGPVEMHSLRNSVESEKGLASLAA